MCGPSLTKFMNVVLCLAGIGLSVYAVHVKTKATKDENYVALCDINEQMSCSRVLTSKYSTGFGLVGTLLGEDHIANQFNSIYGIAFYSLMLLLSLFNYRSIATVQILLSVMSVLMSAYLGYILYILQDVCVVCGGTYLVNFLLLVTSICKRRSMKCVRAGYSSTDKSTYSYTPFWTPSQRSNNNNTGYKKNI